MSRCCIAARRYDAVIPVVIVGDPRARRADAHPRRARLLPDRSTAARSSSTSARPPPPASKRPSALFQQVEDKIREIIPERDRDLIVDNIGLPARTYNLAFTDGSTIGVERRRDPGRSEGRTRANRRLRTQAPHGAAGRLSLQRLSISRPPTWSPRFSISACRRRSTFARSAATAPTMCGWRMELRDAWRPIPGIADVISSRSSMLPPSWPRSTGRARCNSASTHKRHRQQSQHQPELVGAGLAQFLDRSGRRDSLFLRGADAGTGIASLRRSEATFRCPPAHRHGNGGAPVPGLLSNVATLQRGAIATNLQPDQHPAGL